MCRIGMWPTNSWKAAISLSSVFDKIVNELFQVSLFERSNKLAADRSLGANDIDGRPNLDVPGGMDGPACAPVPKDRQVMLSFFSAFWRAGLSPSLLTPTMTKGLFFSFATSDRSKGYKPRQYGHHVPQNASKTTFPR